MTNPYKIPSPALISFSGRTSHNWNVKHFMEIYLIFVCCNKAKKTNLRLGMKYQKKDVPINWLELEIAEERPIWRTKIVTYETASRNGEPFDELLRKRPYLPNPVTRFCTSELKIKVMKRFMKNISGYKDWYNVIGLRYDEPRRVASAMKASDYEPWDNVLPMAEVSIQSKTLQILNK